MNEWRKIPNPPKEELETLYHIEFLSQSEIAKKYNTTQKVVWRWFRDLGIVSRKPYKRFQEREKNTSWKGNDVTYAALHYRVVSLRGRPKKCEVCGKDDKDAMYDWACVGDYKIIDDYVRMCRSCHWKHDKTGNNLPNNDRIPQSSSKKIKRNANN